MWKLAAHELKKKSSNQSALFNFLMHQLRSNIFSLSDCLHITYEIVYQVLTVNKVCQLVHIHITFSCIVSCFTRACLLLSCKCIIQQQQQDFRSSFFILMTSVWHLKAYLQLNHENTLYKKKELFSFSWLQQWFILLKDEKNGIKYDVYALKLRQKNWVNQTRSRVCTIHNHFILVLLNKSQPLASNLFYIYTYLIMNGR